MLLIDKIQKDILVYNRFQKALLTYRHYVLYLEHSCFKIIHKWLMIGRSYSF